jgi:gliding motility-associated lipoprotein GldH
MNKLKFVLIGFVFFGIIGCSEDRLFEDFISVESSSWDVSDSISFELNELDLLNRTSLIAVRFNENYEFSNCYIRILSMDSLNNVIENRLINVPLFDSKSGKPQGKGFGNTYTKYDTIPFRLNVETKKVSFVQYMRQNQLDGIEAVGLKILK